MRLWRGAVLTGAVVTAMAGGLVALTTTPAGGSCAAPTIRYEAGTVDRGGEITVAGTGFGDNCYDTGPPPAGQGALGEPLDGIEVVITQAGVDHVVAEGAADDDYELAVDVVVPSVLAPGEARLEVRYDPWNTSAADLTAAPLVVSDAPATGDDRVTAFGPGVAAGFAPARTDAAPAGGSEAGRWVVVALAVVAVLAVAGIGGAMAVAVVRRR